MSDKSDSYKKMRRACGDYLIAVANNVEANGVELNGAVVLGIATANIAEMVDKVSNEMPKRPKAEKK